MVLPFHPKTKVLNRPVSPRGLAPASARISLPFSSRTLTCSLWLHCHQQLPCCSLNTEHRGLGPVSPSSMWCSVFIVLNYSFLPASLMHGSFKTTKSSPVLFTDLSKCIQAFSTVLSIQWVFSNYCPKSEWIRKGRNGCLLSCLPFMFISISVVSSPNCDLQVLEAPLSFLSRILT